MKLYELFGDRGFHTTIFTTFGVDFDAYENIALARLRGSGCHNNILVADERMLTHALSGASAAPQSAGKLYSVSGTRAQGVFHSKIILQIGRRKGRLVVGSANVTASGFAGNLELAGCVACDQTPSPEQRLIAASWNYLAPMLDRDRRILSQQRIWMEARAPWLLQASPAQSAIDMSDGTLAAFLCSSDADGLMDQFLGYCNGEMVQELLVMSPYWDHDLSALKIIQARMDPARTLLLIDKNRQLFPGEALSTLSNTSVLDISSFAANQFVHAKLMIARTANTDHVLFGSANCTVAALGKNGIAGTNEEACLYRRLPRDAVADALGLDEIIRNAATLSSAEIPTINLDDDLPLDDLAIRYPGSFDCAFSTLIWRPPSQIDPDNVKIQLLSGHEMPLSCSLKLLHRSSDGDVVFEIRDISDRPSMARLVFPDDTFSAPAIVSLADALRNEVRETRGRRSERALAQLADGTQEGLWLLELIDEIEAAEREFNAPVSNTRNNQHTNRQVERQYEKLSYEQFVAGRRLRQESSAIGRNSLAGSDLSFVRAFLNRVLALDSPDSLPEVPPDETDLVKAFDLGDDVSDAAGAVERGDEFGGTETGASPGPSKPESEQRARRRRIQRDKTREHIVTSVKGFNSSIRSRADKRDLTSVDILRLRVILTIVSAAGSGRMEGHKDGDTDASRTSIQVLAVSAGKNGWPQLLGQVLFAMFGGKKPAIRGLKVEEIYDQVPDDLIECWGCCCWTIQACIAAWRAWELEPKARLGSLETLKQRIYKLMGLASDEFLSDQITQVMTRMGDRFATRLGLDAQAILEAHKNYVIANRELPVRVTVEASDRQGNAQRFAVGHR